MKKYIVLRNLANEGQEIAFFDDDTQNIPSTFDTEEDAWAEVDDTIRSIDEAIKRGDMVAYSKETREDYEVVDSDLASNYIW